MFTMTASNQDSMIDDTKIRDESRGESIADYWPLFVLVCGAGLAAWSITTGYGSVDMRAIMHAYMGVFLLIFSLLKIFDLSGFEDGFAMYDLLAKRVNAYGYVYPFLELGLSLMYLSFLAPEIAYWLTVLLFGFGAAGVLTAVRSGLDINCPCMGNILKVPLSTVTLTEDLGMAGMALVLLLA